MGKEMKQSFKNVKMDKPKKSTHSGKTHKQSFDNVKMDKIKKNTFKLGTKKLKNVKLFEEFVNDEFIEETDNITPAHDEETELHDEDGEEGTEGEDGEVKDDDESY